MAGKSEKHQEFAALERSGWAEPDTAAVYATVFAKASDYAVPVLADAARAGPGRRVLDICCGQGNVLEGLAIRGTDATGLDFSPVMLAMAQKRCPGVPLIEGDAGNLPFEAGAFDAVTCGFGMPHVPDPPRVLAEARRVLRQGGVLAYSVWLGDGSASALSYVFDAIAAHGDPEISLPTGPGAHDYAIPEIAEPALAAAGFSGPSYHRVDSVWQVERADMPYDIFEQGTVRGAAMLRPQGPEYAGAIRDAITRAVHTNHGSTGPWTLPIPSVVVRVEAV